jgi:integrase
MGTGTLPLHRVRSQASVLKCSAPGDILQVSRQLGYASIAITADIYAHLVPDATRAAAEAFQAILTMHSRNLGGTDAPEAS